ncbi:mitochondrial ribonuclease P catalytic subunit isoform X2 [Genypterus blacodes]|uniref:mitochondrial ribonuclease P catalytic subunit isoform X2 n=1 Tax=Genypterus blacodes TaxID=154954 RepID=UPI003F766716
MGFTLISMARTCLEHLKPLCHHGNSSLLTFPLCKSPKLPPPARSLCSGDSGPHPSGKQTHRRNPGQSEGPGGGRKSAVRTREEGPRGGVMEERAQSFTLRQRTSFSKSVFAAGTAKRMADITKRREAGASQEEEEPAERTVRREGRAEPPDRPLSAAEWRKMMESSRNPRRFAVQMMTLFRSGAELSIAKSLLTFVATETGTLSYELLLLYLAMCVNGGHDAEVPDVYDIMRATFPSLDTGASGLFIKSFSRTGRLKDAIHILQEVKKVITPSARNYGDIIIGAMLHGQTTTAWELYDELIKEGLSPQQDVWVSLFSEARKRKEEEEEGEGSGVMSQSEQQERLLGILLHMRNNQVYPQQSLASSIRSWFESLPGQKWTGSWTDATPKGVCRCCGSELESIQLSTEEYQQLRDRVMSNIIQGEDVFNKTTPEELEKFKWFVKKSPVFDVVVDGLNVANLADKSLRSETGLFSWLHYDSLCGVCVCAHTHTHTHTHVGGAVLSGQYLMSTTLPLHVCLPAHSCLALKMAQAARQRKEIERQNPRLA